MSASQGVCFDWQNKGSCRRGSSCKFRHVGSGGNAGTSSQVGGRGSGGPRGICHQFQSDGFCRFGNACRFVHSGFGSGGGNGSSRQQNQSSQHGGGGTAAAESTKKFLKHLTQIPPNRLGKELEEKSALWQRCWHEHKTLDNDARRMLIESLAKAPGSLNVSPPPLEVLKDAFDKYLKNGGGGGGQTHERILTQGKTTWAAVTRLIQFEWEPPREPIEDVLCSIAFAAEKTLKKEIKEHRTVANDLNKLVDRIEQPWTIKMRELALICHEVAERGGDEPVSYADWKTANVKWLCNPHFFAPSSCPKMKVGPEGVYDSSEEYMGTVHQLWVAMTFADGHAAFAPHCRTRGNNGSGCNSSLWPIAETALTNGMRCRTKTCQKPVEFACRIRNHDALCDDCAMRSIAKHKKGPDAGTSASTHIYDCRVGRVGEAGILYLKDFKSRNPPPQNIHWRTTKRLSPPNLVGVVKTRAKGAALQDHDLITWGECVYHGNSRDEENRRNQGDLAINVSTIVDFDPEFFEDGGYVAVIDCMSFVPEWVPVLKALESQTQISLPFENGKFLNLLKQEPVETTDFWTRLSPVVNHSEEILEHMIDVSMLEPIREIRRHERLREELVTRLQGLVTQATLDKGQLMSFVDSLQAPVHLTQGPPGTGKSYLGVVLVRALIIIREIWLKKATDRAPPPILVLSYKNHAIDEFLVDLVQAEPQKLRNKLIRIGGQCQDQRLAMYSERNTFQSDFTVKQKQSCLQDLNRLRSSIQTTLDGDIASFLAHRQSYRTETDPKRRRKVVVGATQTIMEMIARRTMLQEALDQLRNEGGGEYTTPNNVVEKLRFLEVTPDDGDQRQKTGKSSASPVIQLYCNKDRSEELVPLLSQELKHYRDKEHWGNILVMFLSGKVPLPPCCFKSKDGNGIMCNELSFDPHYNLCDKHRCVHVEADAVGRVTRCASQCMSERASLCVDHGCQVTGCQNPRSKTKTTTTTTDKLVVVPAGIPRPFCVGHCCRRCIELNLPLCRQAVAPPPRNVCVEHPLCIFPSCLQPCPQKGQIYCDVHNVISCLALTKKKKPCKTPPISRQFPYCHAHKHLARDLDFGSDDDDDDSDDEDEDSDDEGVLVRRVPLEEQERKICAAKNKKGRDCKGTALPGRRFCYDHDLAEEVQISSVVEKTTTISTEEIEDAVKEKMEVKDEDSEDWLSVGSIKSESTTGSIPQVEGGERGQAEFDEVELEEEEEAGNLQHLREVFEIADAAVDAVVPDDASIGTIQDSDVAAELSQETQEDMFLEPTSWLWTMSEDERWSACQSLLSDLQKSMSLASGIVKRCIVVATKEHQEAVIKAKAKMYENKSVIGGTMVGCISRLASIRATRPFAVVVEEASEVLEPLLFSCLTESTIKLEMIGDHRQLQPSVMSRYEFELNNNINTSMFQRLIEAPLGHGIPSTVLSVQRRMRSNICDLTRRYYADVVDIEDEQRCHQQLIGSRASPNLRLTSSTCGREVPGIGPHVFLWKHDGAQKRSTVGISRINPVEAKMACALAKYLVSCGVPKSSIAILTPYKGQLMEMRKLLLAGNQRLLSRDPQDRNVCRLSTVDRFQGDEEDIVICSLVVDENSKTNFVKLVNRMVVLLSRARLGLYVIGNGKYFENQSNVPQHWRHTLELLGKQGSDDSSIGLEPTDVFSGVRSGREIPLCCPIHRLITKNVASDSGLSLGFCTEICQEALTCGHSCRLSCHWPSNVHNRQCDADVDSPCSEHPRKLTCKELYKEAAGSPKDLTHDQISKFVKCSVMVPLTLPCGHVIKTKCWEEKKIISGESAMPPCLKKSPIPFNFLPNCQHLLEVTCKQLEQYERSPSDVKCEQPEDFEPACGHGVQMKCWQYQQYSSGEKVFDCQKQVQMKLPRCGHTHKVPCATSTNLMSWTGTRCQEVGKVVEGTQYGTEDFICRESVTFVRICGHNIPSTCQEAITQSCSWKGCREKILVRNPDCGHRSALACSKKIQLDPNLPVPDPRNEVKEGQLASSIVLPGTFPRCRDMVKLIRTCGHTESIECSDASKPMHGCKIEVTVKSSLCGHNIVVPCSSKDECEKNIFWDSTTVSAIESYGTVPVNAEPFISVGSHALKGCTGTLLMALPCGHKRSVKCQDLITEIGNRQSLSTNCAESTTIHLDCGHTLVATCKDAQFDANKLKCKQNKLQRCWNFENCGNKVTAPCGYNGPAGCNAETEWICPTNESHRFTIPICAKGAPTFCPNCSLEKFRSQVKLFDDATSDTIKALFGGLPSSGVTMLERDSDGMSRIKDFLDQSLERQEAANAWDRTSSRVQTIPCMRVLNPQNVTSSVSFDPSRFVKRQTLGGLQTKTVNASNVLKILEGKKKDLYVLLVGYAAVIKPMDHGVNQLPTGKQGKSSFVQDLWGKDYDSLLYHDPKGHENLIVWDPFPIQAVLVASVTADQLRQFSQQLTDLPALNLVEPIEMGYHAPEDLVLSASAPTDADLNTPDDDDESSVQSNDEGIALQESLRGTRLEGLSVNMNWAGAIDSRGVLPKNMEKELMEKMEFVNDSAKPFVAKAQIENVLSKFPEGEVPPIIHLLLAAEFVMHSSDRADKELFAYVDKGKRAEKDFRIHPWSIVILARLESRHARQLILAFAMHFPLYQSILTKKELALLNNVVAYEEGQVSWSEKLKKSWEHLKDENYGEVESSAMDELLELTGLRKVKEEALRLWKTALQLKKLDEETRKQNSITTNYCFLGNPGTGKSTVARLFAKILCDSGVRDQSICNETTAQEAKDEGIDDFRTKVSASMGGVLFIDEAYDLDPLGDSKGKPIVNELLTVCENQRDEISVILAGYEDDFEKKFFAYNPGLRSRFKSIMFDDFDEAELTTIWTSMRSRMRWREEDGVTRVVVKRLMKLAGKKGFANARAVRVRLENARREAMSRMGSSFSQSSMELSIPDVIGEDPRLSNDKLIKVREEIEEKIGWGRVKIQVEALIKLCGMNYGRELRGHAPLDVFLNRMFLGNPGTGKTTCAKLYGRLLKELGFLSNGDVVLKSTSDFVGSVVGESQKTTNQILESAKGKVLIIDEAYALDDNLYGKQVLDTLVEKVQGSPSDDIAVILIGYEEPMLKMLRDQNPGLSRRFPQDQAFYFDDYDEKQLLDILNFNLKQNTVDASFEFREKAVKVLGVQKHQSNFGNAGAVETLVKAAMVKASERTTTSDKLFLDAMDISDPGSERAEKDIDPLSVLDDLYRMEKVKAKLHQMTKTWAVSQREGDESPKLGHFVFTGSPGTGKTTVARAIAGVLFSLGLLPTDKFSEKSALDLTADFVGQTSTKVENALQEAKGGLLFIDEAYNLGQGPFGKEACDSIVAGMTSEKFQDVVVVIAGYSYEIDEMLKSNSGLKSRFDHFFEFPDWNPEDCAAFFYRISHKKSFELEEGVLEIVKRGCSSMMQLDGWANGRDVTKLWDRIKSNRDSRVYELPGAEKIIATGDAREAVNEMLRTRQHKLPGKSPQGKALDPRFAIDSADNTPQRFGTKRDEDVKPENDEPAPDCDDGTDSTTDGAPDPDRDPGVPDDIWNELKDAKKATQGRKEDMKDLQDRLSTLAALEEEAERRRAETERLEKEAAERLAKAEAEEAERRQLEEEMRFLEEKRRQEEEMARELEKERKRLDEELRRAEEEQRKKEATMRQLQQIRPCPMGFSWYKQGGGWRCGGGSHYVSDEELRRRFNDDDF